MLRIMHQQFGAPRHLEIGKLKTGCDRAAHKRIGVRPLQRAAEPMPCRHYTLKFLVRFRVLA